MGLYLGYYSVFALATAITVSITWYPFLAARTNAYSRFSFALSCFITAPIIFWLLFKSNGRDYLIDILS